MLNSRAILKGMDPRTVILHEEEIFELCPSPSLANCIMRLNPDKEFLCDPFGGDYSRLVFFKDNIKYSILELDARTEDVFNYHKMLPSVISPQVHQSLCKANIIPQALESEWLFNFCIIDGSPIIYDEEIYIGFLKYNIDNLPDFIHYYVTKTLGSCFSFYAFDDDYVKCLYKGKVVTLFYKDIIPAFEPRMR